VFVINSDWKRDLIDEIVAGHVIYANKLIEQAKNVQELKEDVVQNERAYMGGYDSNAHVQSMAEDERKYKQAKFDLKCAKKGITYIEIKCNPEYTGEERVKN